MEHEFITFRTFDDEALANILGDQLSSHQIDYTIEEEAQLFNGSSIYTTLPKHYAVKIAGDKFEIVNKLLLEDEAKEIDQVDSSYYLFDFTNDELLDLLSKADEWNSFDVALARKLLNERGVKVTDDTIRQINEERLDELKRPEPPQNGWVVIGYVAAFLGGVFGIFIGWHLAFYKKTLPNGERVFDYNENDRRHGRIIFYLSIVFFVIAFCWRMRGMFES